MLFARFRTRRPIRKRSYRIGLIFWADFCDYIAKTRLFGVPPFGSIPSERRCRPYNPFRCPQIDIHVNLWTRVLASPKRRCCLETPPSSGDSECTYICVPLYRYTSMYTGRGQGNVSKVGCFLDSPLFQPCLPPIFGHIDGEL